MSDQKEFTVKSDKDLEIAMDQWSKGDMVFFPETFKSIYLGDVKSGWYVIGTTRYGRPEPKST